MDTFVALTTVMFALRGARGSARKENLYYSFLPQSQANYSQHYPINGPCMLNRGRQYEGGGGPIYFSKMPIN